LVRIHACHAWGRGFESRPDRQKKSSKRNLRAFFLLFFIKQQYNHEFNKIILLFWPFSYFTIFCIVSCEDDLPFCSDGIQNEDETGIDCGGSCTPCSTNTVETCSDGIQNEDETGIDCGGSSCDPCVPNNEYTYLSAVIDGQPYIGLKRFGYAIDGISTIIYTATNSQTGDQVKYLWLQGTHLDYEINIHIPEDAWGTTGSFNLEESSIPSSVSQISGKIILGLVNTGYYHDVSGTLIISNFDLVNKEFSGTFEMQYYIEDDDLNVTGPYSVTNGTLDYPLDYEEFQ
jgi:hypothetical protein